MNSLTTWWYPDIRTLDIRNGSYKWILHAIGSLASLGNLNMPSFNAWMLSQVLLYILPCRQKNLGRLSGCPYPNTPIDSKSLWRIPLVWHKTCPLSSHCLTGHPPCLSNYSPQLINIMSSKVLRWRDKIVSSFCGWRPSVWVHILLFIWCSSKTAKCFTRRNR